MRIFNSIIKYVLRLKGYDVVKINRIQKREIYNAYYMGDCFKCIKGDPLTEAILSGKVWDAQIPDILKKLDANKGLVIEIGANVGTSLLPHAQHFPELRFKLYEPVPAFYALLAANHKTFNKKNNVEIYNEAFGAVADEDILINVGLGTAGKTQLVHYQMSDTTLCLKSKKLDDELQRENVALLKIDVDGHELSVLKGAERVLKDQHPHIFLEFAPRVLRDIGQSPQEIITLLEDAGYNHISIWDHDAKYILDTSDWNDVISHGAATPHYLNILVSKKG